MSRRGRWKLYLREVSCFAHLHKHSWPKLKKQNQRFARRRMKPKEKEALCYDDDQ